MSTFKHFEKRIKVYTIIPGCHFLRCALAFFCAYIDEFNGEEVFMMYCSPRYVWALVMCLFHSVLARPLGALVANRHRAAAQDAVRANRAASRYRTRLERRLLTDHLIPAVP